MVRIARIDHRLPRLHRLHTARLLLVPRLRPHHVRVHHVRVPAARRRIVHRILLLLSPLFRFLVRIARTRVAGILGTHGRRHPVAHCIRVVELLRVHHHRRHVAVWAHPTRVG